MIFTETALAGAFIIDIEPRGDSRGFFARAFCQHEFETHGLKPVIAQANLAYNADKGTLRGMHFQYPPAAETKLVRGHPRRDPRHHRRPAAREPDVPRARRRRAHGRQPPGALRARAFAHGYQVLEDDTETTYQVGEFYTPEMEGGLRYDDPRLGLEWPLPVGEMSEKDDAWKLLDEVEAELKERMSV